MKSPVLHEQSYVTHMSIEYQMKKGQHRKKSPYSVLKGGLTNLYEDIQSILLSYLVNMIIILQLLPLKRFFLCTLIQCNTQSVLAYSSHRRNRCKETGCIVGSEILEL